MFVPLTIEIYKLLSVFNEVHHFIQGFTLVKIFSIAFLFALFLVFVSKKLNYYSSSRHLGHQLQKEIDGQMRQMATFKVSDYKKYKDKLLALRKERTTTDEPTYLAKLIRIRDEMEGY